MLDLLGFFTRIPCGKTSLEKAAEYSFLLPVVGMLIGVIVGVVSFVLFKCIDGGIAALLTVGFVYLLTGLNHLDGVADFADGLYTSGTKERKIEAMKDVKTGIAGVTSVLFVLLFFIYGIFLIKGDVGKIIVIEICAKTGMLAAISIGKPSQSGFLGRLFIERVKKVVVPFSLLFSFIVSYLFLQIVGVVMILCSLGVSMILVLTAQRSFGGVSGDALGCTNEVARLVSLYTVVIMI